MTTGDQLWTDQGLARRGATGIGCDPIGALIPGFSFLNLDDDTVQIQLTSGTINISVRRLGEDDDFEVDTPNQAFTISQPGRYRVEVGADGNTTVDQRPRGRRRGHWRRPKLRFALRDKEAHLSGTDRFTPMSSRFTRFDDFDTWSEGRDHRYDFSRSAQYLSRDVVGYDDLDDYGDWRDDSNYGHVWFPNRVEAGWAPYHAGHWDWISPWGWTWVDDSSWGYAPFHYGRWVTVGGRWGWVAGPVAVQAVYAPALVVFIGGGPGGFGGNVGWFPLGPREVYVPSYHVSQAYVTRVNISNTTVHQRHDDERLQHNHHPQHHKHHEHYVCQPERAGRGDGGSAASVRERATGGESRGHGKRTTDRIRATEWARCRGSDTRERPRFEGGDCGSCGRTSGSSGEPASRRQEERRLHRRCHLQNSSRLWRRIPDSRWREAKCRRCVRPAPRSAADGEAGAAGQTGDGECGTPANQPNAARPSQPAAHPNQPMNRPGNPACCE